MSLGLSAALALAAVAAFVGAEWNRHRVKRASNWMQAVGTIQVSRVKESDDDGVSRFWPEIVYRYEVDGSLFRNDRICFGGIGAGSDSTMADLYVEAFPEGSQAVVYYDPEAPSRSVLRLETGYGNRALYGAAAVLIAFSGYAFWRGL